MNNNKYKILVIENEEAVNNLLKGLFESAGYRVLVAKDCKNGKMMYGSYTPDLIILNPSLPGGEGMELLKEIRRESYIPVIVISERADEQYIVDALDMGANDYIKKPFGTEELLARVRCAIRNTRRDIPGEEFFAEGKFEEDGLLIDYDSRRVFVREKEIKLTQTEYNILALLSRHKGKVLPYSSIIKSIWGYKDTGSTKKLQVNIANIRKKIGSSEQDCLINEPGVGYRMCE